MRGRQVPAHSQPAQSFAVAQRGSEVVDGSNLGRQSAVRAGSHLHQLRRGHEYARELVHVHALADVEALEGGAPGHETPERPVVGGVVDGEIEDLQGHAGVGEGIDPAALLLPVAVVVGGHHVVFGQVEVRQVAGRGRRTHKLRVREPIPHSLNTLTELN